MRIVNAWRGTPAVLLLFGMTATTTQAQVFTTLASSPGRPFLMSLTQGADGNFYGPTQDGGTNRQGSVFEVTPAGEVTMLYSFCSQTNCLDGEGPQGPVILATDGDFYGTTVDGGATNSGTVYKLTPRGRLTTLHSFCPQGSSCKDGALPEAGLIQGPSGNFYGTTADGGANNYGTVFEIAASGAVTVLHSFCSQIHCNDGAFPISGLVVGTDGNFYGTTTDQSIEHPYRKGTVFKVTPQGGFARLHNFDGEDGDGPDAALVQGSDGNFYGTTGSGGDLSCQDGYGCGTVFKITPEGALTTLYTFSGPDGEYPSAPLIQATDGNFYGTTFAGGDLQHCTDGCGTVFQITPSGALTTLHSFCEEVPCTDGINPFNGLLQATNGTLYGATGSTIFSLDMGLGPFVTFVRSYGKVGRAVGILGQGFAGTRSVSFNGLPAAFTVKSDTYIKATVPEGATTGYVTVTTPSGTLTSNVPFRVLP